MDSREETFRQTGTRIDCGLKNVQVRVVQVLIPYNVKLYVALHSSRFDYRVRRDDAREDDARDGRSAAGTAKVTTNHRTFPALMRVLTGFALLTVSAANRNAVGQTPIMGWSGCEAEPLNPRHTPSHPHNPHAVQSCCAVMFSAHFSPAYDPRVVAPG